MTTIYIHDQLAVIQKHKYNKLSLFTLKLQHYKLSKQNLNIE